MKDYIDYRPDIMGDDTKLSPELRPEPSIRMLLMTYYGEHFESPEANTHTEAYIAKLVDFIEGVDS